MSDKKDSFKDFIAKNTSESLQKPVNEFDSILGRIEKDQKKATLFPIWMSRGAIAASLVLAIGLSFNYYNSGTPVSDEEIAFLFDNFNDDYIEADDDDFLDI